MKTTAKPKIAPTPSPGGASVPASRSPFSLQRSAFSLSSILHSALLTLHCYSADLPTEFLSSGDFNGDTLPDVLVVDKLTGNARVGYQTAANTLSWSQPIATGVEGPSGCAIGRFLASDRDALALTTRVLNRVHILDLSFGTNGTPWNRLTPLGAGPAMLIGLRAPFGTLKAYDTLTTWTDHNSHDPGITMVELHGFVANVFSPQYQGSHHFPFILERGNSLKLGTNPVTHAAVLLRGTNDTFLAYSPKLNFTSVLTLSNLPPGTEYTFGQFNAEPLPRILFYVPGQSNLTYTTITESAAGYTFATVFTMQLSAAIQGVFYVTEANGGLALVRFGDGVRGLRLPGGVPQLGANYSSGLGAAGNTIRAAVPLGSDKFAILDGPPGGNSSSHSQVMTFNGTTIAQLNSGNLTPLNTPSTRANVWLFAAEPFVNADPGFLASVSVADWTSGLLGLPGNLQVRIETDAGPASGLGSVIITNLGVPPGNAPYGIPAQYRDDISLFSYSPPKPLEPVGVSISPPPGSYTPPLLVTITPRNIGDGALYRLGTSNTWQSYSTPIWLTADTTIQYFGTNTANQRSTLAQATYRLGGNDPGSPPPGADPNPGDTNNPPFFRTNYVHLSENGTVFYGRRSVTPMVGLLGPSGYLSFLESPFSNISGMTYFYLENFEDGSLNTPGAIASPPGQVVGPGVSVDSVDADDGSINGSGAGGHSLYPGSTQITILFDPTALGGQLPTHAGVVWTDVGATSLGISGYGYVSFSAQDAQGASLGSIDNIIVGDGSANSSTGEDRFFGISNPGGISSITLTMPHSIDWELDHLQYGYLATTGTIWAINLDGSGETYITEGARPRISPDGRFLAFLREGSPFANRGNLWVRDLWSGDEWRVATQTDGLAGFDWDLTGDGLLLDLNCAFWRADLAGFLTPMPLPATCREEAPAVNPLDGRVAFHSRAAGLPGIFLTPPNMATKIDLTLTNITWPIWPAWSPDGDLLALSDSPGGPLIDGGRNLWVVWVGSGGNREAYQITGFADANSGFPHGAQFTPLGDALIGAGTIFGTNGIWMIPLTADGAECDGPPMLLATSPGDPIDFVGGVMAAPTVIGTVRPRLFIVLENDAAVVYWSAAYQGFTLEQNTDLGTNLWTPIPGPYDFDGYYYSHREPLATLAAKKAFRLRWP